MTEFFILTLIHPGEVPIVEVAPTVDKRFNLEAYLLGILDVGGRLDIFRVQGDEYGDFPGELISTRNYGE